MARTSGFAKGSSPMSDANSVSEQLVQRIERLERQNRSLRGYLTSLAALGVIGAVALSAFEAAPQARSGATVESTRFVLRNPDGKIVAALGVNSYGTANLVLLDKQERMRADRKSTRLNSSHVAISYAV